MGVFGPEAGEHDAVGVGLAVAIGVLQIRIRSVLLAT